jgi:hypothetical protein
MNARHHVRSGLTVIALAVLGCASSQRVGAPRMFAETGAECANLGAVQSKAEGGSLGTRPDQIAYVRREVLKQASAKSATHLALDIGESSTAIEAKGWAYRCQ